MKKDEFITEISKLISDDSIDESGAIHLIKIFNSGLNIRKPFIEVVLDSVFLILGIPQDRIKSKCRARNLADARSILCKICYDSKLYTLGQIGFPLGRDHSTVLHGIRKANILIDSNKEFRFKYFRVLELVQSITNN